MESTFPNPPDYYKDFSEEVNDSIIIESPEYHLDPPKPIEGEYWNNGVIRSVNTPTTDYVSREYIFLYDPKSLDKTKNEKAEIMKKLLKKLIKAYIELIKKSETSVEDTIQPAIQQVELLSMNIIRLLNVMREYQFRENLIRSLKNQVEEKEAKLEEIDAKLAESKAIIQECIPSLSQASALVTDLNNLLAGQYLHTAKESEEEVKANETNEAERMEEVADEMEALPIQTHYCGTEEGHDHASVVSLNTEFGLFLVCSTHICNSY